MKTLHKEIEGILREYPKTRDSNEQLYGRYLLQHGISTMSVNTFFMTFPKQNVASFESVTRCRRKLVEMYPELGASEEVQEMRDNRQLEMFGYSKGGKDDF